MSLSEAVLIMTLVKMGLSPWLIGGWATMSVGLSLALLYALTRKKASTTS